VLKGILNFFFMTNTGRIVFVCLLLILGAYVGRIVLVDAPQAEKKEQREVGPRRLDEMASRLQKAISDGDDHFVDSLPQRSAWYPADLPCAARKKAPEKREPIWDLLGMERGVEVGYQYRFDRSDGVFTLRARRDSDCDGIYVVHTLEGRTDDWSSITGTKKHVDNTGE